MENFKFEEFKNIISDKLKDTSIKSINFLSNLFSKVDTNLTLTLQTLKENHKKLHTYIENRDKLHQDIEVKQKQVDDLKLKIVHLEQKQAYEQVDLLRDELYVKTNELIHIHNHYFKLEETIQIAEIEITNLENEKSILEKDRKQLRQKYENTANELITSRKKLIEVEGNLEKLILREQELIQLIELKPSEEELILYEQELKILKQQSNQKTTETIILKNIISEYKKKKKKSQQQLVNKMSEISNLTLALNQSKQMLNKECQEKEHIQKKMQITEKIIIEKNSSLFQMQNYTKIIEENQRELQVEIENKELEIKNIVEIASQQEQQMNRQIYEALEEIEELEQQLQKEQNNVAMAQANSTENYRLSESDKQLLKKEFKPRFEKLYVNCVFEEQFMKDFLQITPSDRLQVEAAIAQLSFQYDTAKSKIRPNSVKTASKNFLEYPFLTDSVGRIYFHHTQNQFHFYRISRIKNGRGNLTQDNVIAWLKNNA